MHNRGRASDNAGERAVLCAFRIAIENVLRIKPIGHWDRSEYHAPGVVRAILVEELIDVGSDVYKMRKTEALAQGQVGDGKWGEVSGA